MWHKLRPSKSEQKKAENARCLCGNLENWTILKTVLKIYLQIFIINHISRTTLLMQVSVDVRHCLHCASLLINIHNNKVAS